MVESIHRGFSRQELHAAFSKVENKFNWKENIDAEIDKNDVAVVEAAIEFYAGSPASFSYLPNGRVRVKAPGYYFCIGA